MLPPTNLPRRPALRGGGRAALVRYWLTKTFSGRAIAAGLGIKLVAFVLALIFGATRWLELIDTIGDLAIIIGALIVIVLLFADMKQRLLWRIRHKIAVSYVFIGFVPALLIVVFFMVSGLLLSRIVASYMLRTEFAELVERAQFAAASTALGIEEADGTVSAESVMEVRRRTLASRYAGASVALVTAGGRCTTGALDPRASREPLAVGPWTHEAPPLVVPEWIPCAGYSGLLAYRDGSTTRLVARAVVWPQRWGSAVIVDVPIDQAVEREVNDRVGLEMTGVYVYVGGESLRLSDSRGLGWGAPVDSVNWQRGNKVKLVIEFQLSLRELYARIAPAELLKINDEYDYGRVFLVALAILSVMFLIIQAVALAMGLALARSITGSVHELFAGTERVRRGDFTGRVSIKSRDQLGELAESFNSMTSSIEELLQQKAEKERLEQELRIARNIQMSLLPQGPVQMSGVTLTAHCEPAREVGGDYYDFLPIDDHTIGILVADVSGKGTSAALYMAELKGIVLSLSQRHRSPRELLIEADHIISRHLDSRSFITVTYLVVDLQAGTLQYARAGHCPLIYVPGPHATLRTPQLIAPDGLVLGLQLDEGRTFNRLLEEVTIPIGRGDLFVLYTDGLTEAMNPEGDCFGDSRLANLIGQHADLAGDELRERILREIDAFTGSSVQQDDMTMVVLRVEQVGEALNAPALAHADA